MLTENEARKCWCPFARGIVDQGGNRMAFGGSGDEPESEDCRREYAGEMADLYPCIASECMAFRWCKDHEIELTNGHIVTVDQEDAEWAAQFGWWWDGRYARCDQGRLHVLLYERYCGEVPDGLFVDHADGDAHNCRRGNLRAVTPKQNAANAASRGGASRYRGVYLQKSGRWSAQISKDGNRECLGTYDKEEEAAAAYDEAAKRIHGEYARLNLEPKVNSGRRGFCGLAGKP